MKNNDDEAAFPTSFNSDYPNELVGGMTLRDYFAAKALAAMISKDNKDGVNCGASGVKSLSLFAYEYADGMLEARK